MFIGTKIYDTTQYTRPNKNSVKIINILLNSNNDNSQQLKNNKNCINNKYINTFIKKYLLKIISFIISHYITKGRKYEKLCKRYFKKNV